MLYDATDSPEHPVFLGGLDFLQGDGDYVEFNARDELSLAQFAKKSRHFRQMEIQIADQSWIVAVGSLDGTFQPDISVVILGGVMIVTASIFLAAFLSKHLGNAAKEIQNTAEAEKAVIHLHSAQQQAKNERQLNDFIAHEVRNPLSSAIAALSFISTAVNTPLTDPKKIKAVKGDVHICDSSLQFINDLLRNILDLHRPTSNQLEISKSRVDVKNDILEPVAAILYSRNSNIEVSIDCPDGMTVTVDSLRMKQVLLNLVLNANEFVTRGFICIGVTIKNGHVQMYVKDSGPGIPKEKQHQLFQKYQESLDLQQQGTGLGLSLC